MKLETSNLRAKVTEVQDEVIGLRVTVGREWPMMFEELKKELLIAVKEGFGINKGDKKDINAPREYECGVGRTEARIVKDEAKVLIF